MQYHAETEIQVTLVQILWNTDFLVGDIVLCIRSGKLKRVILINISYLVMGIMFAVMGLPSSNLFILCLAAAFVGGLCGAVYVSLFTSLLQTEVASQALGRVFSMYFTLSIVPVLFSMIATGLLSDSFGVDKSFITMGLVMALVGILAFLPKSSIRIDKK